MERTLLFFFAFFIEAIIIWQYSSKLFLPKHSAKTRVLFLSALYFILFCFSMFHNTLLNTFLFFVSNIFFFLMNFILPFSSCLLHSTIFTGIMNISELISMGIIIKFFPNFLSTEDIGFAFFVIFSKSLFFTVIFFLTNIFRRKTVYQKFL